MAPTDQLPRALTPRYRLEHELGRGGMGVVWAGLDLHTGQKVAIKQLRLDGETPRGVAERFLREVKHTAALSHPNVVRVLDVGRTAEGSLFYVMELLSGQTLAQRLAREPRLSVELASAITRQLLDALGAAHATGLVHRDVKPSNLMLVPGPGPTPTVKLLDFGVAFALDGETRLTQTDVVVGTVKYMAPEQLLGQPVDGRADLYSAAVVLYRMLSGHHPFEDRTGATFLYHAVNTPAPSLAEAAPELTLGPLPRVMARALAKRPEDRYPDAAALRDALAAGAADAQAPEGPHDAPPLEALPFLTCPVCGVDSSRFADSCRQCGTPLDTPTVRAHTATVLTARQRASDPAPASPPADPPAGPLASAPPPATPRRLEALGAALDQVPPMLLVRVGTYALLAAVVLSFFGLMSRGTAAGCVALSVVAFGLRALQQRSA